MTDTTNGNHEAADPDVESDPALDDDQGSDWTSEGGATPAGPATDTDDDSS